MSSSWLNLENYLIPLGEIKRATENFSQQRCIGGGGFGQVYKGQLSERWQNCIVAIKRLGRDSYQGEHEFRNEVEMISMFHHENIISFIGYCDEDNEMIIVFRYAVNGSLDDHLQDPNKMRHITWTQRLMICIGASRGLNYLHSGLGEHMRVIHRDVKSANILLDENFVAKICDFGLSRYGPRNLPNTELFTKVAGTQFYVDPTYNESRILRKESDVYSFGVVMFEMLSGMLVYSERSIEDDRPEFLMNLVRRYDHNIAEKLIDPHIRDQIDYHSFDTFKEIAYQCISFDITKRPTMDKITERIQEALTIQDNVDTLIKCVAVGNIGFSHGKPVAAFTIYKCLIHWKYLQAGRTSMVDRFIKLIVAALEDQDNYDAMAYWLSNASTLSFLIHNGQNLDPPSIGGKQRGLTSLYHKLKTAVAEAVDATVSAADNFSRAGIEPMVTSTHTTFADLQLQRAEARNRALVFMQQLRVYVEILYCIIRDNLKKDLGSLPALCIQDPITFEETFRDDSQSNHWQRIVDRLHTLLIIVKRNFVPSIIVQKMFTQVFTFVNVQLFNSLISRPEYCTFSNGEYVKAGLETLKIWCFQAKQEYAGSAWDELKHIRQVTEFLTIRRKDKISYRKLTTDICPILNIHQLYRICTMFSTPISKTQHVSEDVISSLRILMTKDSNGSNSNSFLLDDDLSIPDFVDDLYTSLQSEDFTNVRPAQEFAKYPAFHFLYN